MFLPGLIRCKESPSLGIEEAVENQYMKRDEYNRKDIEGI